MISEFTSYFEKNLDKRQIERYWRYLQGLPDEVVKPTVDLILRDSKERKFPTIGAIREVAFQFLPPEEEEKEENLIQVKEDGLKHIKEILLFLFEKEKEKNGMKIASKEMIKARERQKEVLRKQYELIKKRGFQ